MAKIILQDVRCSYVYVAHQRKNKDNGDPGGYGVQVLLAKNDPQLKKLNNLVKKVLTEKFGAEATKKLGKYKLPVRDGDDERDGEEYNGMMFMNANKSAKKGKPGLVNRNNEPADEDDIEELCYSGAYFHVSINIFAFKATDGGKPGVGLGLNNVMLRKKGDRLDGSVAATSEFAEFGDDSVDDFDDDDF